MSNLLRCLRRTEPSAALIPHPGQRTLVYVPAARSDIRRRIHEFNRLRIAARAPMGEWVNNLAPAAPKPNEDLPEVSSGTWVMSSYDLLDGTDVTEDALPGELFDELFARQQDALPKSGE